MDTTTAPTPPPAAPAAVPAPTPAPTPPPINSLTKKPVSDAAHKLFQMLEESGDPLREEKPAPAETPPPTPPAVPAAPAAPEPAIKVAKKTPKRPDLPAVAEPAPATPATPPVPTDAKWKDTLLDDEKAALEDAEFAETVDPKHKGLADKMGKFFRDQKEYLEKHPDADEEDPAYKKILAAMPKLTAADKRVITEARIEKRVEERQAGKFTDLQHELYVRDEEPKVEAEGNQIRKHMAFNSLPKEMLDLFKEKGLPELQKQYGDELEVAGGLINTLVDDAKELLRLTKISPKTQRPLAKAAESESDPKWGQHSRIATMVNEVCADFHKNAPESEKVRAGKWFVTRDEWAKLPANARGQFWTFTNSEEHVREMITRAMGWMPDAIAHQIKTRQDSLKARGYERTRPTLPTVPATPAVPPVASTSPGAPRPSPAPAPAAQPAGTQTAGQKLAARLAAEAE